jgi:excisionase family DNA binding protein
MDRNAGGALVGSTEAGQLTGLSRESIRRLCESGEIVGATKIGRDWVIPRAALVGIVNRKPGVGRRVGSPAKKPPSA